MPVPNGEISTSDIWKEKIEEAIETVQKEDAELLERLDDE